MIFFTQVGQSHPNQINCKKKMLRTKPILIKIINNCSPRLEKHCDLPIYIYTSLHPKTEKPLS